MPEIAWVVFKGKVCAMVWNLKRMRWEYIPEKRWDTMSAEERANYIP